MTDLERIQRSQFSPGPVQDDEQLVRLVFYPDHCSANGVLRPDGISREDLKQRGFSVYRKEVANSCATQSSYIEQVIKLQIGRVEDRNFQGAAEILCQTVRSIKDNQDRQAFDVIDAAHKPEDPAHSCIFFANKYEPSMQKKLRKDLCDAFSAVVSKAQLLK